jgi:hypothetical protein
VYVVVTFCVKLATIVALELSVTVVLALFALPNVAVPLDTVQLLNVYPLLAVAEMLTAVPAGMFDREVGLTVPPAVGLRLTVRV